MRPFTFINIAMSADGKIDSVARQGSAISSPEDKRRVDELRAGADAVLVGGNTLNRENPKLTVKAADLRAKRVAAGQSENPVKVGIVTQATLKPDSDFLTAGPARKVIFTTLKTDSAQVEMLKAQGVDVFIHNGARVDLAAALEALAMLGIKRLMVEGGATLNFELLRLGLVDELSAYVAPLLLGGETAPTMAGGLGLVRADAIKMELVDVRVLDESGGLVVKYRLIK
jgi:2,5-diamino-6-(ribosylamino)-4(3H)-pyrimidinone 5'-phosphate reductase